MPRTFVISDNHFSDYDGPGNIIDFFNRPFPDSQAMNEAMVRNWNRVVGPGDTVYSLGDFAWYELPGRSRACGKMQVEPPGCWSHGFRKKDCNK